MRRIMMMMAVGLAFASGCGGSRPEVRVESSLQGGSTQQKLDKMAAGIFNGLLGGVP